MRGVRLKGEEERCVFEKREENTGTKQGKGQGEGDKVEESKCWRLCGRYDLE